MQSINLRYLLQFQTKAEIRKQRRQRRSPKRFQWEPSEATLFSWMESNPSQINPHYKQPLRVRSLQNPSWGAKLRPFLSLYQQPGREILRARLHSMLSFWRTLFGARGQKTSYWRAQKFHLQHLGARAMRSFVDKRERFSNRFSARAKFWMLRSRTHGCVFYWLSTERLAYEQERAHFGAGVGPDFYTASPASVPVTERTLGMKSGHIGRFLINFWHFHDFLVFFAKYNSVHINEFKVLFKTEVI